MPTPFEHLLYAEHVLNDERLPRTVSETLRHNPGAYYLGNTAADVQTLTQQPRVETHFYRLADIGTLRPVDEMRRVYSHLADPFALEPAHAAFLSGYWVHLLWDEMWAAQIFIPHYMQSGLWADRLSRSKHHNGLRVLLDRQAEAQLRARPSVLAAIATAMPHHWLPFVSDAALCQWRDWLVAQLSDPSKVETATVFSRRMGISPTELESIVAQMARGEYPPKTDMFDVALQQFKTCALSASVQALTSYWHTDVSLLPVMEADIADACLMAAV